MLCGALLLSLYSLFAVLGNLEHGDLYQSIPPTPVYTERPETTFCRVTCRLQPCPPLQEAQDLQSCI